MRPVYMEVTQDKYELPVALADSIYELARMRNVRVTSIMHAVNRVQKATRRVKYVKVWIEEEA